MLGISLFKIGELIMNIIFKSRFQINWFEESLLDENNQVKNLN